MNLKWRRRTGRPRRTEAERGAVQPRRGPQESPAAGSGGRKPPQALPTASSSPCLQPPGLQEGTRPTSSRFKPPDLARFAHHDGPGKPGVPEKERVHRSRPHSTQEPPPLHSHVYRSTVPTARPQAGLRACQPRSGKRDRGTCTLWSATRPAKGAKVCHLQ